MKPLRILFLTHSFNSLTQRLYVELTESGHIVSVEFDINEAVTLEAVRLFQPDLILAPFLKRAIPDAVWRHYLCWVLHPGIVGDQGPSALDWAILRGEKNWGVTLLQANAEMDGGAIWESVSFPMRLAKKSSLYRHEVTEAAVTVVERALNKLHTSFRPQPLADFPTQTRGSRRPLMRQEDRRIDWRCDETATILRKIHSADGSPGVLDELAGKNFYLFGAHAEKNLNGEPGKILGRNHHALCRATVDGAVWLTHLKQHAPGERHFKLPATLALPDPSFYLLQTSTWREIEYEEKGAIGFLHFDFYNGAMGPHACQRLQAAVKRACERPIRVLVLCGGPDFWGNGIDLNLIEAAESPADASWANINAMNDLVETILRAENIFTIAAMQGNAGAGSFFLALAADHVVARKGVVLNPHYKSMGNLYGSEYWTYLLPARVGWQKALEITQRRLPMSASAAVKMGLIDAVLDNDPQTFQTQVTEQAAFFAAEAKNFSLLQEKKYRRRLDESKKALATYRKEELEQMKRNFYGFDPSYHVARYNFVHKIRHSRTPFYLAQHRSNNKSESLANNSNNCS